MAITSLDGLQLFERILLLVTEQVRLLLQAIEPRLAQPEASARPKHRLIPINHRHPLHLPDEISAKSLHQTLPAEEDTQIHHFTTTPTACHVPLWLLAHQHRPNVLPAHNPPHDPLQTQSGAQVHRRKVPRGTRREALEVEVGIPAAEAEPQPKVIRLRQPYPAPQRNLIVT